MSRDKSIADELEPVHWCCSLVQHGAQEGNLKDCPSNSSGKQWELAWLLHAHSLFLRERGVFSQKERTGQDGRSGHRRPLQLCRALPGSRQALLGSAGLEFGSRLPVPGGGRAPCPGEARPLSPASQHQLLLRRPGPNFGVNVHCEQSTGAVKNGCQGAHKGGQHDWQHQTPQTWNTEMGTGMSIP